MLRKLVIFSVFAVGSASIPAIYESNPEIVQDLLAFRKEEPARQVKPIATARQEAKAEPEMLLGKKVRLASDARGHFLADFKLNGRAVEAMVDTGATVVAINRTTAQRIGIVLQNGDFKYQVDTANGAAKAAAATIESMQIGRIFVENVEAMVLDDRALKGTLVGMSFLNRLSKFQIDNGALLLQQ